MWPDRVSNPGPLDLRVRCPTDCATQPGYGRLVLGNTLTLLHSEWPKLYGVLAILSGIELRSATLSGEETQTVSFFGDQYLLGILLRAKYAINRNIKEQ